MIVRRGKHGGEIVTDATPEDIQASHGRGHDDVEFYGGFLIAESVPSDAWVDRIISAVNAYDDLLAGCKLAFAEVQDQDVSAYWMTPETVGLLRQAIARAEGRP